MAEKKQTRDEAISELVGIRQPSRRPILPAEVAALGVFLCGDGAANISGASMPIDGAWAVT
jgi:3-hydroxybutyrate dehydrogenase